MWWVNPEDSMTWEQICDRTWGNLPLEMQVGVSAHCEQTGISRNDYFKELNERFSTHLNDSLTGPQYRAEFQHWLNGQRFPCGRETELITTR